MNNFEKTRKENRNIESDSSSNRKPDSELITFDRFNRSSDDQRSHEERHRILAKRFKAYLQEVERSRTMPNNRLHSDEGKRVKRVPPRA